MNEQAIAGILLLDEPELESLRTSPEEIAIKLGLAPVELASLKRADRLGKVTMQDVTTLGTITITASPPPPSGSPAPNA